MLALHAVGGRLSLKMVALDHARKTLAFRRAGDIDERHVLEGVHRHDSAELDVVGNFLDTHLANEPLRRRARAGCVADLRPGGAVGPHIVKPELDGIVPVAFGLLHLQHRARSGLDDSDRVQTSFAVVHLSHAHFLAQ